MVHWHWVLVALLMGAVCGLAYPRLCPRCSIERRWIRKAQKEKKP